MELLITVMTLVAAIYAVVPRERQLDLLLRIGFFDWVVVIMTSFFVFYLEFNDFCSARGWVLSRPWPQGMTPQNTIYLVLLVAVAILIFRLRFKRLSKGKIGRFRELIEQLYWDESYGELFVVLQNNLAQLFRIAKSDSVLSRLRDYLRRTTGDLTVAEISQLLNATGDHDVPAPQKNRRHSPEFVRRLAAKLLELVPEHNEAQGTAREVIGAILLSPKLVRALVRTRPYFGLDIIRQWTYSYERYDFLSIYLSELVRDTTSIFYQEIANNANLLSGYRYRIPESNRALHFLLSDVKFAHDNSVYKPIGDYALSYLNELARDPANDPYNRAMESVPDPGASESPLHATVRFFDIMLEEALHQGHEWHMWLYYLPLIVEKVVRNYRLVDPLASPDDEFPIRYSFLLYEIFSAMRNWVKSLEDVPLDQPNVVLISTRADHENGNIPKSAMLALCACARHVLQSDNLTVRFKNYLVDIVFWLYFDLRSKPKLHDYATVLGRAISQGGTYRPRDDRKYQSALIAAFENRRSSFRSSTLVRLWQS